jgi:cadherin 5 type 2 (VE-cadherin)
MQCEFFTGFFVSHMHCSSQLIYTDVFILILQGYNSPREFLVTQGPLHSTRDDFWRMCWESNSRAIVMLTRCIEKGREKCDHYWPYDTMPVYYGDISVQILNDSHYQDWSITEFMMCRVSVKRCSIFSLH